jgi:hypothetical protein
MQSWEECPAQLAMLGELAPGVQSGTMSWEAAAREISTVGPERTVHGCRNRWKRERKKRGTIGGRIYEEELFLDGRENAQFTVNGNRGIASSSSKRIKTLSQLIGACEIDLDVWRIERWLANKWEVGAKAEYKDLTWNHGVIDGFLRAEGLSVEPLFQVKAWLVKQCPEPLFPTIQPIKCAITYIPPSPPQQELLRSLVLADPHFWFQRDEQSANLYPLHDRRALDIVLQIADAAQPDRIDMLGDSLDMTDWTGKFLRTPDFTRCTQPSLLECHWWLSQFRAACPAAVITIHEGNHDKRLRSALLEHLPAAYGLKAADEMELPPALSLPKLLGLSGLAIGWVGEYPDDESWLNTAIMLQHGDIARTAGNSAKAVVEQADYTTIMGHIHRVEWVSRTKHGKNQQRPISAFCPGCLCHVDGRVPATRGRQQWQQGCAIIDYDSRGHLHAISPITITEGEAIWNGRRFRYRDRLPDLKHDMPNWHWS